MATVVVSDILEGATANAASMNSTISSWNSNSSVNGSNLRAEGIEKRNIQYPEVTPANDGASPIGYYRSRIQVSGTLFEQGSGVADISVTSQSGNPLIWTVDTVDYYGLGPMVFKQATRSDDVFISFSGELVWNHESAHASGNYVTICISTKNGTGSTGFSQITKATRRFGLSTLFVAPAASGKDTEGVPIVRSFTIRTRLEDGVDYTSVSPLYIGVEAWKSTSSGSFEIRRATLEAHTKVV